MGRLAQEILDLFKNNYRQPKLWIATISILIGLFMILPYIDSNFFYYARMEKRINILEQVIELDNNKIQGNQIYKDEYNSILKEIQQQDERNINSIMNKFIDSISGTTENTGKDKVIRFFTGALIWIILLIFIPFMNTFKRGSDKVTAFIVIAIFGVILGYIGMKLPILFHPVINYLGFPILQITILVYIMTKADNKK